MSCFTRPEFPCDGTPDNVSCLQVASAESVAQVCVNLDEWTSLPNLDCTSSHCKLKAAALVYDIEHILKSKPRLTWSVTDIPGPLQTCHRFTEGLVAAAKKLVTKAQQIAGDRPTSLQFGPFQESLPPQSVSGSKPHMSCSFRLASLNLRGGLGSLQP